MQLYGNVQVQSNEMEPFTRRPAFGLTVVSLIIAPGFWEPSPWLVVAAVVSAAEC